MSLINTIQIEYHKEGGSLSAIVDKAHANEFFNKIITQLREDIAHGDCSATFVHGDHAVFSYDHRNAELLRRIQAKIEAGEYPYLTIVETAQ